MPRGKRRGGLAEYEETIAGETLPACAVHRRRRFVAVAILGTLFFAAGTQAAALVQPNRIEQEKVQSPGVEASSQRSSGRSSGSTATSAGKSLADGTAEGSVASHDQKPKKGDGSARKAKSAGGQDGSKLPQDTSGEPLDVLVLGVDRRPDAAENSPSRSDTMMLVRVTPATGDVELLSVPRDLYVQVQPGVKGKINSAYAYGGVNETIDAVESYAHVPIDHYAIVDFEGFQKVIDAMGGVRVDVGHGVFPQRLHMGEGVRRLDGRKALTYARYRGTPRADLDRIDHQQQLIRALRQQALRWNTVTKLPSIIKTASENVTTDLGIWQAIPLARALVVHGKDGKMTRFELQGDPTYLPDGTQVLVPKEKVNEAILKRFRE